MPGNPFAATAPEPAIPAGGRVYAIGDVHGRLDLLDTLLDTIERDDAARNPAQVTVVLLGDLVDRGPDSRGVVARARAGVPWGETVTLMGNHEAIMLGALGGDLDLLVNWLRFGGRETLVSWGIDPALLDSGSPAEIAEAGRAAVSSSDREWLAALPRDWRLGGYYFVHAGIRPGVSLDRQTEEDKLWIRQDFLASRRAHGAMIVHGHTISEAVELLPNRIGLDTGAYASGRLSAIGLEGTDRWPLST